MEGTTPINTSRQQFSPILQRDNLHVMEAFIGATCGVLYTALVARYKVKVYTYSGKDPMSQKMARTEAAS